MGVQEITLYAFSIENFKRSPTEVKGIFELIYRVLIDVRNRGKWCIRILGDIHFLPHKLQQLMAEISLNPRNDLKKCINFAIGYTSRAEMTAAVNDVYWGRSNRLLTESDINESLLESCFWSASSLPVDLLIRSSGEIRLSDFLLWQMSFTPLIFDETLWPEMGVWNIVKAFFRYQQLYDKTNRWREEQIERRHKHESLDEGQKQRKEIFLQKLTERRRNIWQSILSSVTTRESNNNE